MREGFVVRLISLRPELNPFPYLPALSLVHLALSQRSILLHSLLVLNTESWCCIRENRSFGITQKRYSPCYEMTYLLQNVISSVIKFKKYQHAGTFLYFYGKGSRRLNRMTSPKSNLLSKALKMSRSFDQISLWGIYPEEII